MNDESKVASYLLGTKAVKLSPANPFTWASGWKSPIYCDNRKLLSHINERNIITAMFNEVVNITFDCDGIAAVATAGIPWGSIIADNNNLPLVYIRKDAKTHGLENMVEGDLSVAQRWLVVEDLVSTGGSSLHAVEVLKGLGKEVAGMVAVFTYGFAVAAEAFAKAECELVTLTNYETLIEIAVKENYVTDDQLVTLQEWRKNPDHWRDDLKQLNTDNK